MGRIKFIAEHGGSQAEYAAIHRKMRKLLPQPILCSNCLRDKKLEIANISDTYKDDATDWEWLCRRCHMLKDNRMGNLTVGFTPEQRRNSVIASHTPEAIEKARLSRTRPTCMRGHTREPQNRFPSGACKLCFRIREHMRKVRVKPVDYSNE